MTFTPDWRVHPSETLEEAMHEREMSRLELALLSGLAYAQVRDLLDHDAPFTQEVAQALQGPFPGIPVEFWIRLQEIYDEPLPKEQLRKLIHLHDEDDD